MEVLANLHPAAQVVGAIFLGIMGCLVVYGIFVQRDDE
jgi:hypothetical protein